MSNNIQDSLRPSLLALAAALALAATPPATKASHVGDDLATDQQTIAATDQLLQALRQWENAPEAVRAARLQQLMQRAAERRDRLLRLIERNPRVAAARLMPAELRSRLPAAARAFVEEDTRLTGTAFAVVASDVARGFASQRMLLAVNGQTFDLALGDAQGSEQDLFAWAGRRLNVQAVRLERQLLVRHKHDAQVVALDGLAGADGATTPTTTPVVTGDQKTLVILANFSDKALTCGAADVHTRVFAASGSSVNTSVRQSSRDAVSFSGAVAGPFNIAYSSTGACEWGAWGVAAEAAAKAAGFDPAQYKRVNVVTPSNSTCGWSGLAYMPGTRSWVQSCASTGVYTHELQHNLALHHATTPSAEYGDGSDPMGGARNVRNNAAQQVMAGWVPTGGLLDVGASGSFAIAALGPEAAAQPQVLRIVKPDSNERYYVSTRGALGLDAALNTAYLNNVAVHRASGTLPAKTTLLASLAVGQSYVDAANGITIVNQASGGNAATVGVTLGAAATCTRAAPGLAIVPASRSGAPGGAVSFTATVSNANSAACGSAAFNLTAAAPAGFGASVAPASVTLAPGASASSTWTVSSPASTGEGTHGLDLTVTETGTSSSRTAHATYVTVVDNTPPQVALTNPAPNAVVSGRLTLSATASDASGIARVEFHAGGKLLASDSSAPYSAAWNLRKAAKGAQTITVKAFDNAGLSSSASVTVTVQ
jgi:Bacterial Ig domain/Gametolysin peptidase M11/NPCBM-associated, NEW3 domain of alpha-galactosidase